jgi:hypothetical protein
MPLVAQGSQGSFNGTTEVELVPAPSSGSRMIRSLYVNNNSGGQLVVLVAKKASSVNYTIFRILMDDKDTLEFGDGDIVCLTAGESVVGVLESNPATNPAFVANWGDK